MAGRHCGRGLVSTRVADPGDGLGIHLGNGLKRRHHLHTHGLPVSPTRDGTRTYKVRSPNRSPPTMGAIEGAE